MKQSTQNKDKESWNPSRVQEEAPPESAQHWPRTSHVEAFVATQRSDDRAHAGRWRRNVAEAEVLPEGVVASDAAPEAADAGGDAEGTAVEAFEDSDNDVLVVVDEEDGSLLFVALLVLLHHG
ncbi:hypothetical protein F3Y22_tig00002237pilonHSYRG01890 [Hibiscus syriacus]|uniref:Uncharacterized protein n=1 Tax=Hibiscus syriacus TaxID=106335 RepID=A0A6A3CSR4_HIBSY|nr:hypothetical protein F3Y22_tig00002237pilonHSYRG01890 [Hibiscus syriacus]